MNDHYYYSNDGKAGEGTFSLDELRSLIRDGVVAPEASVRISGSLKPWQPLSSFPELRDDPLIVADDDLPVITIDGTEAKEAVAEVARAMKAKERFKIVTSDRDFDPLGYDPHSAHIWIGAAGGGVLMTIGAGTLVLAFLDPEPTSKLTALIAGGVVMTLAGGGLIVTILVTRSRYTSAMRFDHKTKKYEWVLSPH